MATQSQDSSIAASLRDEILRGQYRCGERLPSERDLAQRFGVHRGAVREALKRLEQLGIAEIRPGGARVAPLEHASVEVIGHLLDLDELPDPDLVDQALEAMSGLRAMAARLGTERASDAQREALLETLAAMRAESKDAEARIRLVTRLGDLFVEASGNRVIALVHRSLRAQRERAVDRGRVVSGDASDEDAEAELDRLTRAIETGDGATASESVYALSRILRQRVREHHARAHAAPARRASGERS